MGREAIEVVGQNLYIANSIVSGTEILKPESVHFMLKKLGS